MDNAICNLKNLAFFVIKKNERESMKTEDSQTLPINLTAYSEKIINDLVKDFSQIKSKFEKFNFANENVNIDAKFDLAAVNSQSKVDLESNLNANTSKSRK